MNVTNNTSVNINDGIMKLIESKGSEDAYQQALFKNDPPAKMSILKVHFPGKKDYIFDS